MNIPIAEPKEWFWFTYPHNYARVQHSVKTPREGLFFLEKSRGLGGHDHYSLKVFEQGYPRQRGWDTLDGAVEYLLMCDPEENNVGPTLGHVLFLLGKRRLHKGYLR